MRISARAAIAAGLLYFGIVLFQEARLAMNAEIVDQSRVVMLFGAVVLTALVGGGFLVVAFLPMFGNWLGNLFFNPNEQIERSPHAAALAASERGDFERAIVEYRDCLERDSMDTLALSEIARLQAEKLGDPQAAVSLLEEALLQEWPPEEVAFLKTRLANLYWTQLHDATRSRELLQEIVAFFPDSQHAVNARRRLRAIDRELPSGR
jgi:tetratricopeptide (TPR) repeat protein